MEDAETERVVAEAIATEAFEHGGRVAGLATTLGFILAFALSVAEQGG